MRAGRLRRRVVIEQVLETIDAEGQPVKTWSTFTTVQAAVEPMSGREFFDNQQINDETTTRITIRYIPGVTAKMRVVYDSKYYNIRAILNVGERDRELRLMCTDGVNLG